MRLVLLDTNVIVSAGIKPRGFPAQIVQSAIQEANIQIVVSPSIVAEYRRVSRYSKFAQYGFPPQWLEFLIESALRFSDGEPWPHPVPDPDDARFLSLAHKTGAWLITGNLKHYPVESREGVTVHTPSAYVTLLNEHS
jgi:putative PIN family toxin of toxin-antitoxin system